MGIIGSVDASAAGQLVGAHAAVKRVVTSAAIQNVFAAFAE